MSRNLTRSLALILLTCGWSFGQGQDSTPPNSQSVQPAAASENPSASAASDSQAAPVQPKLNVVELEKRPRVSKETRMRLIQAINAEFARTRKTFPVGYKDITLTAEGRLKPEDSRLYQLSLTYGSAARVGDRIQITNIAFHDKSIYLEINGGPKKKTKWYQHITIGGLGGSVTPGAGDPSPAQPAGSALSLEFKDHVPEMTGPELKQLLDPVFDFSVKTAAEVYLETVPPKVKEAIKKHEVLVGMNHDMVVMAKDRPGQKLREKDEKDVEYEEWIYGKPPQDVTFVRFVGDEVTQVKIMKVSGERILKTEKEVDVKDGVVSLAAATARVAEGTSAQQPGAEEPAHAPTLKRPGETDDSPTRPRPPRPDGSDPKMPPKPPPDVPPGQPPN